MRRLGLIATTNPQGAAKWRPEFSERLCGRDVVIPARQRRAGQEACARGRPVSPRRCPTRSGRGSARRTRICTSRRQEQAIADRTAAFMATMIPGKCSRCSRTPRSCLTHAKTPGASTRTSGTLLLKSLHRRGSRPTRGASPDGRSPTFPVSSSSTSTATVCSETSTRGSLGGCSDRGPARSIWSSSSSVNRAATFGARRWNRRSRAPTELGGCWRGRCDGATEDTCTFEVNRLHSPESAASPAERDKRKALVSDKRASGTPFTRTSSCTAARTNRRKRASNVTYGSTQARCFGLPGGPRVSRV